MQTHHIHIGGLVQGVGFRPYVCQLAQVMGIKGTVYNGHDGVHIEFNATEKLATNFYSLLFSNPPVNAVITKHTISKIEQQEFDSFFIQKSKTLTAPDLIITPDIAICSDCKKDISDKLNRRYQYPFTTCLNCGPRYSIMNNLPYDRENTTMDHLPMCSHCQEEYLDINSIRHFSQTNTCKECAIPMHWYNATGELISSEANDILSLLDFSLKNGKVAAIKGIGGYLLICDAANAETIAGMRIKKQRPAKPFALLYKDIEMAKMDVTLSAKEINALQEKSAPIVLCHINNNDHKIALTQIAPGLNKIGIMLPYSALLLLIIDKFNNPLVATSANISGSPIIFRDDEAIEYLADMADFILIYNRDIVTPQDDSVIQFTDHGQRLIIRRGRGLAPAYFPNPFILQDECILAMGSELKSAFALYNNGNVLVSQYLGDQASLESQKSFSVTRSHLQQLLKCTPQKILVDKHPGYVVSAAGRTEATASKIGLLEIQHHKAHFAAVLAEHELHLTTEKILGVIWDGNGYGDDEQIWGSEIFLYKEFEMKRVAHLAYFPQLLGDKMNKEPRLSALSLLINLPEYQDIIKPYYSDTEWKYYRQLIKQPAQLFTSSMGRFLDGLAAILGICTVNSFEGEATLRLEAIAQSCSLKPVSVYALPLENGILNWQPFIKDMLEDYLRKEDLSVIAYKIFSSLVKMLAELSHVYSTEMMAFSGGVFQNALLNDLVLQEIKNKQLYFHQKLSPNDECIGFGQLAYYFMTINNNPDVVKQLSL